MPGWNWVCYFKWDEQVVVGPRCERMSHANNWGRMFQEEQIASEGPEVRGL